MHFVGGVDLDNELERLRYENAELKRKVAAYQKAESDRSWHDDYIRDTYITPNWKADGQW